MSITKLIAALAYHNISLTRLSLGSISVEEFAKAMKASGQNATEAEVQHIIDEVDRDGDGTIDFEGRPFHARKRIRALPLLHFRIASHPGL